MERALRPGKAEPGAAGFWETKPAEELYDLESDPYEVKNLADSPGYRDALERLRKAQRHFLLEIRDVGFLPEDEIHTRSRNSTPYQIGHSDRTYPLARILDTALGASSAGPTDRQKLSERLRDPDSAVRYWAVLGLFMHGEAAVQAHAGTLREFRGKEAPAVRIASAFALASFGSPDDLTPSLQELLALSDLNENQFFVCVEALNAIDTLGSKAAELKPQLSSLPRERPDTPARDKFYIARLLDRILKS